jgi:hypothetical protein
VAQPGPPPPAPKPVARPAEAAREPASWREVEASAYKNVAFEKLPPDSGLVSPIAANGEEPDPLIQPQLDRVRNSLAGWPPAQGDDPVQRVRNLLYVAAAPDLAQMSEVERFLPLIVFDRLKETVPPADLQRILYWVALHPNEGDDKAIGQLDKLGLPAFTGPTRAVRPRVMLYAFKLLGRLTGDIK